MKLSNIIKSAALGSAGLIIGAKLSPLLKTVAGSKVAAGASKVTGKLSDVAGNMRLNQVPVLELVDEGLGQALKLPNSMETVNKANTVLQTPLAWARMYLNPKPAAKVIYRLEKLRPMSGSIMNSVAAALGLENIARIADSADSAYNRQLDKFAERRGIK
jgi:hypothetical protein